MKHNDVHISELLGGYARGELDDEQVGHVTDHLATCAECRDELRALQALLDAEPPPLTRSERERLDPVAAEGPGRGGLGRGAWWAAAAVVVVVAVGLFASGLITTGSGGSGATGGGATVMGRGSGAHESATAHPKAGARLPRSPQPLFEHSAGTIDQRHLSRLANHPPFTAAATLDAGDAAHLQARYAARLEAHTDPAFARCLGRVQRAIPGSALAVYGGNGTSEGRRLSVAGFVYAAKGRAKLDHYLFWAWPRGRCTSSPALYVSGQVGAGS